MTSTQAKDIQHLKIVLPFLPKEEGKGQRHILNFPPKEGKIIPALVQHMLPPHKPTASKIQTSKTEHKIAILARDAKQLLLCHVAVTHTLSSVTRATVDAAMDGKKSTERQDCIFHCSTTKKGLKHLRPQMATVQVLLPSPG